MAQFSDTLFSMIGRVRNFRPGVSATQVQTWINDRIRQSLDSRTYWSDLLSHGILSVPSSYATGTVSATVGSTVVTGAATAWPVSDTVNTTVTAGINEIGYVEVTPVSMANIAVDTLLYVDAAGTPETVAVVEVSTTTFTARFTTTHTGPTTLTTSSLCGMQFRLSSGTPIFTVNSVQSATQLTLNNPWGAASVAASTYQIVKAYFTLAPDLKDILTMVDPQYGLSLRLHVPVMEINFRDAQRSASGNPECLVDLAPSAGGSMQYELYPWQFSARQLSFIYHRQWPELRNDTDRPPWFMNPTIFVHGALADAFCFKSNEKDIYHNPDMGMQYERRFLIGLEDAKNADESKFQRAYQFNYEQVFGARGANFWQSHDPDLFAGNF